MRPTCALVALSSLTALPLSAWSPGTGNESTTSGFVVDTQSRNDVISFWHCVYMESEGFQNNATSSQAFKDDVQRRINYYRAMAGLSADINMTSTSTIFIGSNTPSGAQPNTSTTKQAAAQDAAEMMADNSSEFTTGGGVGTGAHDPHDPPTSWSSDGSIARNGAFNSVLAIGLYGPAAIDAYISEDAIGPAGAENDEAGHRRLLFQTRLQEVATGDIEPNGSDFSANAVYVRGNLLPSASAPAQFVSWPNAGFIPEDITPQRWSLSYRDADFSNATVTATDGSGTNVPVTIQSTSAVFGDETIIWEFNSSIPSAGSNDQTYNITVSNIDINSAFINYSYQVTIINPDRLLESLDLSGSVNPPDSGANYFFDSVEHAEEYELDISSLVSANWFEGAENGTTTLINDLTDPTYNLLSTFSWSGNDFWDTGSQAFRLAFPRNEFNAFQEFQINRTLIPRTGGAIEFRLRRGFMSATTTLSIQSSTNGGATWTELDNFPGITNNQGQSLIEDAFYTRTVPLSSTDQNTLVRFVLQQTSSTAGVFNIQQSNNFPYGAFIDGIEPVNCDVLDSLPATSYSASANLVILDDTTANGALVAGNPYTLRLRVRVGCHWFPFGNSLEVIPVTSASLSDYEIWFRGQYPLIGAFTDDFDGDGIPNGIEHVFDLNPIDSSDAALAVAPQISGNNFSVSHAILPGETIAAEYSNSLTTGSWLPATVTYSNNIATATAPINSSESGHFIRWVLVEP